MESLHYLILVNLYLLLFYGFYYVLLRNETFFRLNRTYLVGTALLSFLIPFIQLDWLKSLFITNKAQAVTFMYDMMGTTTYTPVEQPLITAGDIVALIYITGLTVFFIRFIIRLINIRIHLNKINTREAFSFFKQIKVASGLAHRNVIMKHEQVHANHFHSADIILFEIVAIINWFNPVVYLYKKAIKNIHEFTADEVAASFADSKNNYSMILLSNAFGVEPHQLTNSFFNHSLLKQRIHMLNKTKSKKAAILKYGLSAPLFAGMLILSSATVKEKVETSEQIAKLEPKKISEMIKSVPEKTQERNSKLSLDEISSFTNDTADSVKDLASIEVLPEFPGGYKAFGKYIGDNFVYSSEAKKRGVEGKIILSFVVEKNGELSRIKILKDLGFGTGEEGVRLLKESPKWKPGVQKGKNVRVAFTLPIAIKLKALEQKNGINLEQPKETKYSADDSVVFDQQTNQVKLYGNPKIEPNVIQQSPKMLYIVDGKETDKKTVDALKPANIKSMYVLKDISNKYGDKGKYGVIEIITKVNENKSATETHNQQGNYYQNIDFKGLLFVNGKEVDNKDGLALKNIKPNEIESMNLLKDKDAIKAYGARGGNGVIQITLKKK